jgi:cytochrome c-type biogenesis protein CcmE
MKARGKFVIGSGIIVATLLFLAYVGFTQSKTYYHTISELSTLQGSALHQRMRVSGNVRAGSISHVDGRVDFVLEENGKALPVSYVGSDPLPDTFKDGAQALVEGRLMPQGAFVAQEVQAKCASKYQASPTGTPAPSGPVNQPGQSKNEPVAPAPRSAPAS